MAFQVRLTGDRHGIEVGSSKRIEQAYIGPKVPSREGARLEIFDEAGGFLYTVSVDLGPSNIRDDESYLIGDVIYEPRIDFLVNIPDLSHGVKAVLICPPLGDEEEIWLPLDPFYDKVIEGLIPVEAPGEYTKHHGDGHQNRYNILVLGEAYAMKDVSKFHQDVDRFVSHLFSVEPFASYSSAFNVYSVFRASKDSGTDNKNYWSLDTAYGSSRSPDSDRCARFSEDGVDLMLKVDAKKAPPLSGKPIVLLNTDEHTGCAGPDVAVSWNDPEEGPLTATHELGHVMGLGDEYVESPDGHVWPVGSSGENLNSPLGLEPVPDQEVCLPEVELGDPVDVDLPNVTAIEGCPKWSHWHGDMGVYCCYEGANGKKQKNCKEFWRPAEDCAMRTSEEPFCAVCREALVLDLREHVRVFDDFPTVDCVEGACAYRIESAVGPSMGSAYSIRWKVNETILAQDVETFQYAPNLDDEVKVEVVDQSPMVRQDRNGAMSGTWTF